MQNEILTHYYSLYIVADFYRNFNQPKHISTISNNKEKNDIFPVVFLLILYPPPEKFPYFGIFGFDTLRVYLPLAFFIGW